MKSIYPLANLVSIRVQEKTTCFRAAAAEPEVPWHLRKRKSIPPVAPSFCWISAYLRLDILPGVGAW
jgi:hypothetical protein